MAQDGSGISLTRAFQCAAAGVAYAAKGRNFRIQLGFAVAALALSLAFTACAATGMAPRAGLSGSDWACLFVCMGGVLGGECANTALEAVVDLASPGYHELAKVAKDCAAGGVLVASLASLAVAAALFVPRAVYVASAVMATGLA